MAFALLSIFEPSIVKKIHEMTLEPDTIDVKVMFYPGQWENAEINRITVPKNATIHDLKVVLSELENYEGWLLHNMAICVHQPWLQQYEELSEDEDLLDWVCDYDEFHLKLGW